MYLCRKVEACAVDILYVMLKYSLFGLSENV